MFPRSRDGAVPYAHLAPGFILRAGTHAEIAAGDTAAPAEANAPLGVKDEVAEGYRRAQRRPARNAVYEAGSCTLPRALLEVKYHPEEFSITEDPSL
jgi:hypothetical protein